MSGVEDGATIINVDFVNKKLQGSFTLKKSKEETQLTNLIIELDNIRRFSSKLDVPHEFNIYLNKACNSIIMAYRKLLDL